MRSSRHPYRLHVQAYGVALEVCSDDQALLDKAQSFLPFGSDTYAGVPYAIHPFILINKTNERPYRLRRANRTVFQDAQVELVLGRLRSLLILEAAENSPDRIFIHAGVVGWRGRAILLPGRSFAGKTTLTAELVRAGGHYYSDEYAVVDPEGLVYPYAQDLQIRTPGSAKQTDTAVSAIHGQAGIDPLRVSLIAFTQFEDGAEWLPEPLSPGRTALELMGHTISARREPAVVMKTLTRLVDGARAVRSKRGEAALTAALILQSLAL